MAITREHLDRAIDHIIGIVTAFDTDKAREMITDYLVDTDIVEIDEEDVVYETITYKGTEYPLVTVYVPGYGYEPISVESLNESFDFSEDEARFIDENVFFYAPDEYINDPNLGRYVARWCN